MTSTSDTPSPTKHAEEADRLGDTTPAPATALPVPAGQTAPVLARLGRYEVLGELGHGGMGVVYRGKDPALDRPVALKLLAPQLAAQDGFRVRFLSEARSLARIEHANVVRVYDVGEEGGQPFFAMELLLGRSVDQLVKERGPLPVPDALAIVRQAADGLAAAQRFSIIHRDIKPQNLLIDEAGKVKVLDFGLAKMPDSGTKTATDCIMGTPEFMSPEQARGEPPDHRSDMYALGATLYYLLAGAPPFTGSSALAIIQKQAHEMPPPIDEKREDVPEPVRALLAVLLSKDPNDRPADHSELVRAIDRALVPGGAPRWPAPFWTWLKRSLIAPGAVARAAAFESRTGPIVRHGLKVGLASAVATAAMWHFPKLAVARLIFTPVGLAWGALWTFVLARAFGVRIAYRRAWAIETASASYVPAFGLLPPPLTFCALILLVRARWQMLSVIGLGGGPRAITFIVSTLLLIALIH